MRIPIAAKSVTVVLVERIATHRFNADGKRIEKRRSEAHGRNSEFHHEIVRYLWGSTTRWLHFTWSSFASSTLPSHLRLPLHSWQNEDKKSLVRNFIACWRVVLVLLTRVSWIRLGARCLYEISVFSS